MKTLLATAVAILAAGYAFAQGDQNHHSWSNYYNNQYSWGTNALCLSNAPAPKLWSNYYNHSFGTQTRPDAPVQNRFGQKELPADAKAMIQQFQQDRQRLMTQLKTASDEQRQQILKEMDQLRTQLRDRICELREQAQQQAEQMRNRLGNNRDRVLDQGAGNGTTGGRDR